MSKSYPTACSVSVEQIAKRRTKLLAMRVGGNMPTRLRPVTPFICVYRRAK